MSESMFVVKNDTILRACDNAIRAVTAHRKELFEKAVADRMRPSFWKKNQRPRQDVEEEVRSCSCNEWANSWFGIEYHANRLRNAAKVCNRFARLDRNDAAFIGLWIDDEKGEV